MQRDADPSRQAAETTQVDAVQALLLLFVVAVIAAALYAGLGT